MTSFRVAPGSLTKCLDHLTYIGRTTDTKADGQPVTILGVVVGSTA